MQSNKKSFNGNLPQVSIDLNQFLQKQKKIYTESIKNDQQYIKLHFEINDQQALNEKIKQDKYQQKQELKRENDELKGKLKQKIEIINSKENEIKQIKVKLSDQAFLVKLDLLESKIDQLILENGRLTELVRKKYNNKSYLSIVEQEKELLTQKLYVLQAQQKQNHQMFSQQILLLQSEIRQNR